jgi:hypothetical protein
MALNVMQMDWIMANYAKDNPKDFKFTPASEVETEDLSMRLNLSWANVLIGRARAAFLNSMKPKRPARKG